MPWYLPPISITEAIKKRVCIYLLQRYLGQFLEEKLTLDQLSVDLYNGRGTIENVSLDVQALNELGEKQNWPMEFVNGYLEKLSLKIPWSSLLKDSTFIEVYGLHLTLQPKQRNECATSMFESMWSSMTNSMQLAQECMKQDTENVDNSQPLEGIEIFAQAIDSILSRVKIKFIDSVIQIEHVPKDSLTGVGILINIACIEYLDEAANDPPTGEPTTDNEQTKAFVVTAFTTKKFSLDGVRLQTIEFPSRLRTFSQSVQSQSLDKEDPLVTMLQQQQKVNDDDDEDEQISSDEETHDALVDNQRHSIVFGKFIGRQEIRVRLKQSEEVNGPKVSIEINLGAFNVFLTPRQLYMLVELANGLSSPDLEDTSNVAPRQKCIEKPMTGLDYQRVEQELQQQLHMSHMFHNPGLQGAQGGWSTAPLDESDCDDNFLPMHSTTGVTSSGMYDSAMSTASSSMESSLSSSMASSLMSEATSHRTRRKLNNIDSDPTAEISHFHIKIASLVAVLLHEDLLTVSNENEEGNGGGGEPLTPSSVKQMQKTADVFFQHTDHVTLLGYGVGGSGGAGRSFDETRPLFERACKLNQLRLLAAPIQIECDETTTLTAFALSGKLTAAKMEVFECLKSDDVTSTAPIEYVRLLHFTEQTQTKPNFRMSFKHIEKTIKTGMAKRIFIPKTDISMTLDTCVLDVDITIVDRISALLNPPTICVLQKAKKGPIWNNVGGGGSSAETKIHTESQLDIKLAAHSLTIKLRFPIPDYRPAHDMQRQPWWKRNVRASYLSLVTHHLSAQTNIQTNQPHQKYTLQCRSLDVFYMEKEHAQPLHIANASVDERNSLLQEGFNWPRLVILIYPTISTDIELEDSSNDVPTTDDLLTYSFYGTLLQNNNKGPFSGRRLIHESDTPHAKHQDDMDELIIPGDRKEISDFIERTTQNARIQLEVNLPNVAMQLLSKHIYEVIYNHISSDLLLWESSAPLHAAAAAAAAANAHQQQTIDGQQQQQPLDVFNLEHYETFSTCKSGIQYDSDSDSESEDVVDPTQTSNIFYSVYETKQKLIQHRKQKNVIVRSQSYLTLNLHIGRGVLTLNPPVRDHLTGNVIPEQQGEFVLYVEEANIFNVTGYMGDDNLGYVCIQSKGAKLHHCDMIKTPSQISPIRDMESQLGKHLHPTIYKSEYGMQANAGKNRGGDREMLSIAVKVQSNHETHHVKTVRVAIGINGATLRHRICAEPNSWITQLIDFFNVNDYTIAGYHAKDVLTELHLHLWDCAIDYRPFNLPLRCAATLGTFSMSSHLSATANTSTLRFIAEECNLFLSDRAPPRNGIPSTAPIDLRRDFVSVLDLGLFELSLRTNDKCSGINPHIDLRASNNILHIRTCADSGRALMQLITYIANDGDLIIDEETTTTSTTTNTNSSSSNYSSPRHCNDVEQEEQLVSVDDEPQNISNLSKSQHQQVNELLGDAMEESLNIEERRSDLSSAGANLFFFPDEGQQLHDNAKPLAQVTSELGDITFRSNKSSDTDDEFCIIGEEAGLGIMPRNGLPEIRWLSDDPLRIIDNHFNVPLGKTDILKPPKHYPPPLMRYTLCDMSLIWQLYGGQDFKSTRKDAAAAATTMGTTTTTTKTVNFSDMMHDSVAFSKTKTNNAGEIIFGNTFMEKKKQPTMDWIIQGGINRDHNVLIELQLNKIRFQHEVYPDNTTQASRQVLLVTELEIRDRLQSSQINKFLYQHTSQARPRQSHAHMIAIKALHVRPDLKLKAQECCLRVSALPLRLNIDQDTLLFLILFFNELSGTTTKTDDHHIAASKQNTPTHHPPVMTISMTDERERVEQAQKIVDDNLLLLLDDVTKNATRRDEKTISSSGVSKGAADATSPIYFRKFIFSPDVPIRLDYHGKRLDLTHGPIAGLIMGLGQLNSSELRLKRLANNHGLLGVDKLVNFCITEWINDIKKNQLPSLLGGVGPMHSLVQFFQGIRDLFWLPIEQYQKDGRIVRGLQRGANSFTTSTAMAALELTSRIIHLIQITAETAYDMMSPGPSVRRALRHRGRKKRYNQPQDIREGMANAYNVVREGFGETAENIVRIASHEHEQKGYSGAVGGVLRQIPPTFVKPIIIASEATNNVLGGMQSQLLPDARREANQKWKNDDG